MKKLLLLIMLLLPSLCFGQATITGTFAHPSGATDLSALGLRTVSTVNSIAMCGEVWFWPWDSSADTAVRLLYSGVTYGPQPVHGWIRCSNSVMYNHAGSAASVALIPNVGATPTGTVWKLRVRLEPSTDGSMPRTIFEEQKSVTSSADWGSLAVAGITALTYTGYNSIADEGTPLTGRTTLNFTGSGVSCVDNSGSTRTDCTISSGSVTVEEEDGSPQIASASTLRFDQADGFVLTNPSGAIARIDCADATGSVKGCLTAADWTTFNSKQAGDADLTTLAGLTYTRGDLIVGGASAWTDLAIGANLTVLASDGTDVAWTALTDSHIPDDVTVNVGGALSGTAAAAELAAGVAGAGLSIDTSSSPDRLQTASNEENFLTSGALTCGAGTRGKMQVHTTPLQYCDNAATPALQYAAYADSAGAALAGDSATSFFSTGTIEDARLSANVSLLGQTIGAAELETDSVSADELNVAGVEAELEAALDLQDLQGTLTAAKGGTGDDTSASTGVPRIAAGNWTYDAGVSHLAASTSADLAGVLSDEYGTDGVIPRVNFSGAAANDVLCVTDVTGGSENLAVCTATTPVNAQTGTTYTILSSDRGKLVSPTNGSSIAVTLPQAGGAGFEAGFWFDMQNRGAGTVTITPTTSTIDGAASLTLITEDGVRIMSDGTNYFTQRGRLRGHAHTDAASGGTIANITGNAATATALAANGGNCTNQFPRGVDASGVAESCASVSTTDIANDAVTRDKVETELRTFTKSITIIAPTTSDSNLVQVMFPHGVTITRVSCSVAAATSVTIQLDERAAATPNTAGTDVMTSTLVCDVDEQATTSFTNATIASRVPLNLQITAVSGTVLAVRIQIEGTID